jgi:alkylation response protein AidB-like acyl-CoA dehydrogenase
MRRSFCLWRNPPVPLRILILRIKPQRKIRGIAEEPGGLEISPSTTLCGFAFSSGVDYHVDSRSSINPFRGPAIYDSDQTALEESLARPLTTLSEDEQMFRDSVREFAEGEIRKRVEEMDEQQHLDPAVMKQCFELGLMGIETPENTTAPAALSFQAILAVEELSRVDASLGVFVDVQNTLVNNAFIRWGNADQKKKYLTQLATEKVGAYALSEAGSGSDAFAMQTRATDAGDHFVLNGRKLWITNGKEAEIFVLFANANPEAGYRGITAFIVERVLKDSPSARKRTNSAFALHRRRN